MSQPLTRHPKTRQFSHAAAAMGAFWERTRKSEARRLRRVRQIFVEGAQAVADTAPESSAPRTSLRRSW